MTSRQPIQQRIQRHTERRVNMRLRLNQRAQAASRTTIRAGASTRHAEPWESDDLPPGIQNIIRDLRDQELRPETKELRDAWIAVNLWIGKQLDPELGKPHDRDATLVYAYLERAELSYRVCKAAVEHYRQFTLGAGEERFESLYNGIEKDLSTVRQQISRLRIQLCELKSASAKQCTRDTACDYQRRQHYADCPQAPQPDRHPALVYARIPFAMLGLVAQHPHSQSHSNCVWHLNPRPWDENQLGRLEHHPDCAHAAPRRWW